MRKPDNLVALHYEMTGSYVVDAPKTETRPLDKWAMRQILEARQIITDLVEYAEQNDPGNPHIGRAKGFLSGGDNA